MSWNSLRILDLLDGNVTPVLHRLSAISSCDWSLDQATLPRASSPLRSTVECTSQSVRAQARAGRARDLPRPDRNSTVQFGWPTIVDFIRHVECVRHHAPLRCQSIVSGRGFAFTVRKPLTAENCRFERSDLNTAGKILQFRHNLCRNFVLYMFGKFNKGDNKHHETKTDIYQHSGSSIRVPIDGDIRSASSELRLY